MALVFEVTDYFVPMTLLRIFIARVLRIRRADILFTSTIKQAAKWQSKNIYDTYH